MMETPLLFAADEPSKPAKEPPPAKVPPAPATPAGVWTVEKGLAQPESAYFDPTSNAIYVSNIEGSPVEKDGKGYISKISPEGKMLVERWVDGLNAPKGLRSVGPTLYVTDLDAVLAFDLKTAKLKSKVAIPNAKFLNDIAIDNAGVVYVSDMFANAIYRIENEKATLWHSGPELPLPNGLLVHDEELIVASFGEDLDPATFAVKKLGQLWSFNLKTKERQALTKQPLGNLDGLENDGSGGYYVSDWKAHTVYHVEADGIIKAILTGFQGPADIGLIEGKRLLLVPRMMDNKLTAYDLEALPPAK